MKRIAYMLVAVMVAACFTVNAGAAPASKKNAKAVKEEVIEQPVAPAPQSGGKKAFLPLGVYVDQGSKDNHYSPSGWMGDFGDLKVNPGWMDRPHSGKTCVKITYSGKMTQNAGWTGMYWQDPANNWGDRKGGFNLTGATKLTFWARGEKGGEKVTEFKFGGITGEWPDSDSQSIGPIELSNQWQKYSIDLADKDMSDIIGGFCWSASRDDNPNGFTIYLDDIRYE